MRELTASEIEHVSGGWSLGGFFTAVADTLGFDGKFGYDGGSFGGGWGLRGLGSVASFAWNLPNTLIGTAVGGIGYAVDHLFGDGSATFEFSEGALRFNDDPFNATAMTIGRVQIFGEWQTGNGNPAQDHESQHVIQGDQLGPFYLPSNLLGGVAAMICDGEWHGPSNWNETGPQSDPPRPW